MIHVKNGFPSYGQKVGILVFDGESPRVPGDAGHASTFQYPVCYEVISGNFMSLVQKNTKTEAQLMKTVMNLRNKRGIVAFAGDCGLMSLYQRQMGVAGGLAVASSLCQIPMIWQMIGRIGKIGVITGHSEFLKAEHLSESGCDGIPVLIYGMEEMPNFKDTVIEGGTCLNTELIEKEICSVAKRMVKENPDMKAIVLECSNLATYSRAIAIEIGIPVFDLISAMNMMEYAVNPPMY